MRIVGKSIVPALLVAVLVAASGLFLLWPGSHSGGELLLGLFIILLYGWPEYLLLAGAHYGLLRRYVELRAPGYAAGLGAGLALVIWQLGVLLYMVETPASAGESWRSLVAYGVGGAVYGGVSAWLYRRYQLLA